MKVWIISFLLLLGLVEFYQWFQRLALPLPILLLGGALLAFVSNSSKATEIPLQPPQPIDVTQNHGQPDDQHL